MTSDPFQLFLNVPASSDALTLLGLTNGVNRPLSIVRIEAALRERLALVYQHPHGRSDLGEEVRKGLRRAADELRGWVEQRDTSATIGGAPRAAAAPLRTTALAPVFNLTPFDRLVLAVLVASGGWNAKSRARLVALASAYGVTVQGLMRVVLGLSRYAQTGGQHLRVQEITGGQTLLPYPVPASNVPSLGAALLQRMTENLSTELKRDDPWPTIKLSFLFGLVALALLIIVVRLMLTLSPQPAPTPPTDPTPTTVATTMPITPPPASEARPRIARFPVPPTFLGNALPHDAIAAAAQVNTLAAQFDELVRKLTVEDEPSEAVYQHWRHDVHVIATSWVLADVSTRREVEKKVFEALMAAGDRPQVSDRLLSALTLPPSVSEPLDLWRGAWMAMMLQRLSSADVPVMPPMVTQRARIMIEPIAADIEPATPDHVARRWLDSLVPQLVAVTELSDNSSDHWELWLTTQRTLGRGEAHDASIMGAIREVLATSIDLSRPGPTVNVLGRMLTVAFEEQSNAVKLRTLELFDDEVVSSRDLWVMTSLLAQPDVARWFPARLVLPEDADQRHRWRVRDELDVIWPAVSLANERLVSTPTGRAVAIDSKLGAEWLRAVEAMAPPPADSSMEELMRCLVRASRLNEAAEAMAQQENAAAERLLSQLDIAPGSTVAIAPPASPSPLTPFVGRSSSGGALGPDGAWAASYQDAGRSPEQRIDLLRALRNSTGSDLGQVDAEVLVREVYRATPLDVRTAAQEIVPHFSHGAVVAQAMLDQFGEAPANEATMKVVAAFTGETLHDGRTPGAAAAAGGWIVAARLALLRHALDLIPHGRSEIDVLAAHLLDSYVSRLGRLRRDVAAANAPESLAQAAELLAQAWAEQCGSILVAQPTPDSPTNLQRRRTTRQRLAEGEVQKCVAQQLSTLEFLAYLTAAEQPNQRGAVAAVLRQSTLDRAAATNALHQSWLAERTMAQLWRIRMGLAAPASSAANAPNGSVTPALRNARATMDLATRAAVAEPWRARLEQLDPARPSAYFDLAEEIVDLDSSEAGRALARHLFALSGVLDPDRFGRSACLALAPLETDQARRRELLALGMLLGQTPLVNVLGADHESAAGFRTAASGPAHGALPLSEALGHYRRGQGTKALEALRKPGADELLDECDNLLLGPFGGAARIRDDSRHYKGQSRPTITPEQLVRMLRLELALLAADGRPWSADVLITANRPLIEVDPERLAESLGADGSKPYFRNGAWRAD